MLHLLLVGSSLVAADITISVHDVGPIEYDFGAAVSSPVELLAASCPEEFDPYGPHRVEVLISSFNNVSEQAQYTSGSPPTSVIPSSDSIVRGAIEAWAKHQHLVLRPDEIWFEILAQLNMYMAVHAEDLRDLFVNHEGREKIEVQRDTWYEAVGAFSQEIQDRVKTNWLMDWIMPGFTTSSPDDEMTATVLMMGLMQYYFEFGISITCGLPRVTLLGDREDWERLLAKLDRLPEWGREPADYANNLRPILRRFVQTFDEPESEAIRSFWAQIVRADDRFSCDSGPSEYSISGWITGFLHWRRDGRLRVRASEASSYAGREGTIKLDKVTYVPEPLEDIPIGYAKAPVTLLDYPEQGTDTDAFVLAGNVAVRRSPEDGGYVRAQPMSAWFLYALVAGEPPHGRQELDTIADAVRTCRGDRRIHIDDPYSDME
ncbi:hypothetical protein B0I35DRAFT_348921 [Stachybotrys elegans]|uniref:DUF4419 domain-containing protein n=1 Tax=Stachybotrys elegans TaxID=80388 RepID=A0A8K0WTZ5_9HYPO|nr:hypothetical protein B0I35DRAFT_348921 [Stachybotrys elegans]